MGDVAVVCYIRLVQKLDANKDPITHNVYSQSTGNAFDVKTQKAGESSDVKFDTVGDADVQCAIHPSMKMRVHVTK